MEVPSVGAVGWTAFLQESVEERTDDTRALADVLLWVEEQPWIRQSPTEQFVLWSMRPSSRSGANLFHTLVMSSRAVF